MSAENLTPDQAQYRRSIIAACDPDAPGVSRRKESFLESVMINGERSLPDQTGSFWTVAKEIASAQIEAARIAEEQAEARRSKWSDELHDRNIHD